MSIGADRKPALIGLASKLGAAWKSAGLIAADDAELPVDRAEAYFVQDRMAGVVGAKLSGWKVGATSARMRELDGHDDVIPGRIFAPVTFQGAALTLSLIHI